MVRIGLLGGVAVHDGDGRPVHIGSARTRTVLAALALSPGRPVPVPRLIDLTWGEAPPATAAKALQWHIARLRSALGAALIVRSGAAYILDVDPEAVDVVRFERRLREGDHRAALAEWTGTPLAGLDAPGLVASAAALGERHLGAVEADLEERAAIAPGEAVAVLTGLTERHPLRENLWALLMTALYRAGRQGDALAAYRRAREHLVGGLGVEPGPRLRALEARVLAQDLPPADGPGHLPRGVPRLIGRDEELRAVSGALAEAPVVTLTGPGGIGKTQLALAAAREAAEARLVELAGIAAPADVPRAFADALGVGQRPGRDLTGSLVAALGTRSVLLVVDNCEHVLAAAAATVAAIVAGCPDVRVLATSRERLSLPAERVVAVGSLAPEAAAELFGTRARAADRGFDAAAHTREVAGICARLDGIPLAIELAAARAVSHRPADLLARLDGPAGLGGARRTGEARHRTLCAAIRWSHDLLDGGERTVFGRLSVFAGPFDAEAAQAVVDVADTDDVLGALVERSMLTVALGPGGRRFRMLEPIRRFAAESLEDPAPVAARHARWCLGEVTRAHRLLTGPGEAEGVALLAGLWPQLRAAVAWACETGDPALAAALVRPVVTELPLRGRQEIGVWAERLLTLTGDAFWLLWAAERRTQIADPRGFAELAARHPGEDALSRYARAYAGGDGEALRRCLPEAVAGLSGEPFLAAYLEMTSAGPLLGAGRFAQVDASVTALARRYRDEGPPTLLHWALQTLGYSAAFQGRPGAERYFDDAAAVAVPEGTLSANKSTAARAAFRRGERDLALALLGSHVDELIATDNVVAASVVGVEFITVMAALGREAEASVALGHLARAGEFGALAARTLVPDSLTPSPVHLGDRDALVYMREVIAALRSAGTSAPAPPEDPEADRGRAAR
ncbi:hypothetical protein Afil01_50030 [Actinorhabdospora filicis]|uniref:OmpR/PhoB-type domain-containing protein n=1 Tax=Actinorhabdospora filicis TaxID=1785913 RepID=A0A9W6WC37_9ACTN|nr:BTAD domain-containing putative transcriptional regulator [Actinorhabdospora filicis]GLZ80196.1 hypothetical protein Afil01_50030 [Actinorhabdospora filicis]